MKRKLRDITLEILKTSKNDSKPISEELFKFYQEFPLSNNQLMEYNLSHGLAISEKHAADCILDYKRTNSFMKGIHSAISSLLETSKSEKIHILYAGSGPYAPLLVPMLNLFEDERLHVTFIDINENSLAVLRKIIATLELEDYVESIQHADAITYKHPRKLDMICSETMFSALTREPQASISENLIPQLSESGILIPEEINISMGYSMFAYEPFVNTRPGNYNVKGDWSKQPEDAIELFSINKSMSVQPNVISDVFYESDWLDVNKEYQENPDICIYTKLKIFGEEELVKAESTITNPLCIGSTSKLKEERVFKLKYITTGMPYWKVAYK